MQYFNTEIFAAITNTGTIVSPAVDSRFYTAATVQAKFTDATAAGTLTLQGSNDPTSPTNWNNIPNLTATVASGALTTTPTAAAPLCFMWIRASFVSSAGAGTITAYLHANG